MFIHPSLPVTTLGDLLGYARANPGKLNYGTGNGTAMLANALFAAQHKLDMVHVPYRGDGPLSIDLIAGRVNVAFATPGTLAPQVKEGKLRVLATMLPSRNPLLPQAPTLAEAGFAPVPITPWGGLFGPPKLPKEIVDRVGREIAVVLATRGQRSVRAPGVRAAQLDAAGTLGLRCRTARSLPARRAPGESQPRLSAASRPAAGSMPGRLRSQVSWRLASWRVAAMPCLPLQQQPWLQ